MTIMHEYIVTLKSYDDLNSFYEDMETPGGNLYIPNRAVELVDRRPISRNTHYNLTEEEAVQLRQDSRVLGVTRADRVQASIKPLYTQTGNFSKQNANSATHLNWGMIRCLEGQTLAGWGSNGTTARNATISFSATGKNVDVVIIDGHIDPSHPELQRNADGTGGSRVIQLDWNSLTGLADTLDNDNAVLMGGTYTYPPYVDPGYPDNTGNGISDRTDDNNHGVHVAGTACGSTLGWARDANIYNISPYGSNPNTFSKTVALWDYVRAFHRSKSINPVTGTKNPTICNCSYGNSLLYPFDYGTFETGPVVYIRYRGANIGATNNTVALSEAQLTQGGIYVYPGTGIAEIPFYSIPHAADITDALADGIHIVGAAGNEYSNIDIPGGIDYENYFYEYVGGSWYEDYHHRGTAPAAVPGVICVGAIDATAIERKVDFSNCGARIDVYAPGTLINSSLHFTGVNDPRNTAYKLGKYSGTSMASPQVCGVLACALEIFPTITPAQGRNYIISNSTIGQILNDPPGDQSNLYSLQGSVNRYLYALNHRPSSGQVYPNNKYFTRPTSGQVFPRVKKRVRL